MLDRKKEALAAWDIADEWKNADKEAGNLLELIRSWKSKLGVTPSYAFSCAQHYADMFAQVLKDQIPAEELIPADEEMAQFGDDFSKKMKALFTGEYAKYARPVFELHKKLTDFYDALAAYSSLKPGGKGKEEATPNNTEILEAVKDNKGRVTLDLTLKAYNHKITPAERYARARSEELKWPDGNEEGWRIPVEICTECNAKIAALITLLYYRHRPVVTGNQSEFYPLELAATGIYLDAKNQPDVVANMMKIMQDNNKRDKDDKNKRLILREVYYSNNIRERRIMAALSKDTVDKFVSVNDKDASPGKYITFNESAENDFIRAAVGAIADYNKQYTRSGDKKRDKLYADFIKAGAAGYPFGSDIDMEALRRALLNEFEAECSVEKFKNDPAKKLNPFANLSAKCVLKLLLIADWVNSGMKDMPEQKTVSMEDLRGLLSASADVKTLQEAKKKVFFSDDEVLRNMSFSRIGENGNFSFKYRIFVPKEKEKVK